MPKAKNTIASLEHLSNTVKRSNIKLFLNHFVFIFPPCPLQILDFLLLVGTMLLTFHNML